MIPRRRAPKANAYAEHWGRSVREECLNKIVLVEEGIVGACRIGSMDYYNHATRWQQRRSCEQQDRHDPTNVGCASRHWAKPF